MGEANENSYVLETTFSAKVEEIICLTDNDPNAPEGKALVLKAVNKGPNSYTGVRILINNQRWVTLKLSKAKQLRDTLNELNLDQYGDEDG